MPIHLGSDATSLSFRPAGRERGPPLVVIAGKDAPVGPTPPKVVTACSPRGELVVLDRCGHFPRLEQPHALRRAVDPLLAT